MSKNNGQWRRSTATGQQRRANGNRSTATVNGNGMAMRDWQQRHDNFFEKKKNNQKKSAALESFWKKSSPHRSISKKKISWIWHQKKNCLIVPSPHSCPHVPCLHPHASLPTFPSKSFDLHIKKTSTHRNGQDQWAMVTVNGDEWTATGKRRWSMVTVWQWATGSSDTIIVWRKKISSTGIIWKKLWKYTTRKS